MLASDWPAAAEAGSGASAATRSGDQGSIVSAYGNRGELRRVHRVHCHWRSRIKSSPSAMRPCPLTISTTAGQSPLTVSGYRVPMIAPAMEQRSRYRRAMAKVNRSGNSAGQPTIAVQNTEWIEESRMAIQATDGQLTDSKSAETSRREKNPLKCELLFSQRRTAALRRGADV